MLLMNDYALINRRIDNRLLVASKDIDAKSAAIGVAKTMSRDVVKNRLPAIQSSRRARQTKGIITKVVLVHHLKGMRNTIDHPTVADFGER